MHDQLARSRALHSGSCTGLALALLLFLVTAFAETPVTDWSGAWDSRWRDGGAVLLLEQEGQRVTGTYPTLEGEIEGTVDGNTLRGMWRDPGGEGNFTFSMAPDGRTFMGRFGTGEWWTAERKPPEEAEIVTAVPPARSPAETLYHFLLAGNEARDGRTDRFGPVLPLLDFGPDADTLIPITRIERAALLFNVLDRLTFRIWSVQPRDPDATEHADLLTQAGTDIGFEVRFRRAAGPRGDDRWRMLVPDPDEMEAALAALLEVYGGEIPHARQHQELRSPRDTMRTFLEAWDTTGGASGPVFLRTMDLSQIPAAVRSEEGVLRGEYLKEVIDRIGVVLWQEIPDNANQTAPYIHFMHPEGQIKILPVQQDDGQWIWQFSAETVASARPLFMALEDMPLAEDMVRRQSTPFFEIRNRARELNRGLLVPLAGVELWQWIALMLWVLISVPVSWILTWLVVNLAGLVSERRPGGEAISVEWRFAWPLRLLLIAWSGLFALRWLGLPQTVDIPLRIAIGTTLSITGGWLAYNLIDKVSKIFAVHAEQSRFRNEILHSLTTSLAKLAVIIGAVLFLAEVLSIPYQGVIAGLGIGGAALALASQGTLQNVLGGITLSADKPVEVGDFGRFGGQIGVVESIGLRSVRIRSLDRTLVTIPNSEFANIHIENFAKRDRILLRTMVQVRYETTPDQLRWVLTEIRKLLLGHPEVTNDPARARFVGFGAHSIDIEIFAYVATSNWNHFLAVQEDLFLRIIDIVDESGTGFAFPSMVNYLARDTGVDEDRRKRAEEIITELRNRSELPFPDFDPDGQDALSGTVDFPPEGSVGTGSR